jgi:ribosome-associated translation inhibitor RaiA
MSFILGNIGHPVLNVDVKLSDINGPKGGVDKKCQVSIQLKGLANVVVTDTQGDMYYAIDRACSRALRTIRRRLSQKLDVRYSRRDSYRGQIDGTPLVNKF